MKQSQKSKKNKGHILSRYNFITFLLIIVSLLIVGFLANTTIRMAPAWNKRASEILLVTEVVAPERGKILADDGSILAANLHFYRPFIDWNTKGITKELFFENLDALCDSLAVFSKERGVNKDANAWKKELKNKYYGMDERARAIKKRRAAKKKDTTNVRDGYHVLFKKLTYSEYARLHSFPYFKEKKNQTGLTYDVKKERSKPFGEMAKRSIGVLDYKKVAHIDTIDGQVRIDSVEELHGVSGLEHAFDHFLYGIPGRTHKEQLTHSIVNWEKQPAKKGYDVQTTININIQDIVEDELYKKCIETEAEWGTALLMEVKTGKIKAVTSLERDKTTGEYREGLTHATLGYEPGSVVKLITIAAVLEEGKVSMNTVYPGSTFMGVNDAHYHATVPAHKAICFSSNVAMMRMVMKTYEDDPGGLYSRLKKMGLFEPLRTGIAGERIPRIDSLKNNRGGRLTLSRQAFGYATQIPPLSTMAFYNAVANDGKFVRPRIVDKFIYDGVVDSVVPETYIREQMCSPENARKLKEMLHDVVWHKDESGRGTGWSLRDDDVEIAGKTGTCNISVKGGYLRGIGNNRLAFCGFFPYDEPKYTCMVLMSRAKAGAAGSSGKVLLGIAKRLYAQGYLGEYSDYKQGNEKAVKETTLYATHNAGSQNLGGVGVKTAKRMRTPAATEKGCVPNVIGLSAKEAVALLENLGLSVKLTGAGYVAAQNVESGTPLTQVQEIQLTLSL